MDAVSVRFATNGLGQGAFKMHGGGLGLMPGSNILLLSASLSIKPTVVSGFTVRPNSLSRLKSAVKRLQTCAAKRSRNFAPSLHDPDSNIDPSSLPYIPVEPDTAVEAAFVETTANNQHSAYSAAAAQDFTDSGSIGEWGYFFSRQELLDSLGLPASLAPKPEWSNEPVISGLESIVEKQGLGKEYEETNTEVQYRYAVDEDGRLVDMLRLKEKRVPEGFALSGGSFDIDDNNDVDDYGGFRDEAADDDDDEEDFSDPEEEAYKEIMEEERGPQEDFDEEEEMKDWVEVDAACTGGSNSSNSSSEPRMMFSDAAEGVDTSVNSTEAANFTVPGRYLHLPDEDDSYLDNIGSQNSAGVGGAQEEGLVLKAFVYCIGQKDLFNGLWELNLVDQIVFVNKLADADVVIHRRPKPKEKQFHYEQFRKEAKAKGIPFVSVWDASKAELQKSLLPVFDLYSGRKMPQQVLHVKKNGKLVKNRRIRL